jgi:hypothetical protein
MTKIFTSPNDFQEPGDELCTYNPAIVTSSVDEAPSNKPRTIHVPANIQLPQATSGQKTQMYKAFGRIIYIV